MAQRIYQDFDRQDRYYGLDNKNQRDKVSKMTEIENYVTILIENNRNYAEELNSLRKENTHLRGQTEVMMGEMLKLKQNYEQIIGQTKSQYNKEVGALIDELKDILNKKQQMEGSYKSLLEQLSYQSQYDKKARTQHLNQLERNYQNKIKILNERIQQQNKQLQSNYYLNSDSKIRMVKEIDALQYQVSELRKQNNDLQQAEIFHLDQIGRLSLNLKLLSKEKEQMGVNLLKIEQQKNQFIIQLRQSGGIIREELDTQIENLKKMQVALIAKQKQLQIVLQKYQNSNSQKIQYEQLYHKVSNQLNQTETQLAKITTEHNRLSDYSSKELKRMSELIRNLQLDKNKLLKQKQDLIAQHNIKQNEIYTLLQRMQTLQSDYQQISQNFLKLQQQTLLTKKNQSMLRDELESVFLERQNERDKCMLQINHIQTLEQIIQKQKRKGNYFDSSFDREAVSKQISNQQSKKYELQIDQIIRTANQERISLTQHFQLEKDRLIRLYEKLLRQKQTSFMQKIGLMQSEIRQIAGFK